MSTDICTFYSIVDVNNEARLSVGFVTLESNVDTPAAD